MFASGPARRTRLFALAVGLLFASATGLGAPFMLAPVTQEAMVEETTALARALGDARRTTVHVDWERRLIGVSEARAVAESIVRGAFAPGDAELDEQMFRRLGLLSDNASYLDLLAGAVAREPAGFYDPMARRLSVPSFLPLSDQRPTLAHEIAHALQDQRVGLRRFLKMTPDGRRGLSFDALLARQALVEGDAAVLAMEALEPTGAFPSPWEVADLAQRTRDGTAAVFDRGETSPTPVTMSASPPSAVAPPPRPPPPLLASLATPGFLRELLGFPYSEGFAFVAAARGLAPWSALDALWTRPPESTAQILHPRKYERHEVAPAIELPTLPLMGRSFQLARLDTLGELVVRVWLSSPALGAGEALPPEVAERAATGWRGDRMAIYLPAPTDQTGVVQREARGAALAWITAWDSDADAEDFLHSLSPRLSALASEGGAAAGAPILLGTTDVSAGLTVWRARAPDSVFAVQRRGALVALLLGAPEVALPSLTTMLDAWSPRREAAGRRARGGRNAPSPTR